MPDNTFAVRRNDITLVRSYDDGSATAPLPEGAARLRVGPFALTANNVTYAALGDMMNYFDFFPVPDASEGRVPAWGLGDVVESSAEGVTVGQRYYGYFPMSSHLIVTPTKVKPTGFFDGAPHRQGGTALYNQYQRCDADPMYRKEHEAQIALLRPLFGTSFLLDAFLTDHDCFGAGRVVLSSASSKTAYGTAFCLSQRRGTPSAVEVVGLTSDRNLAFVEGLGCYDRVVTYDAIAGLSMDPAVYVDFAGAADVTSAVHGHFGDALRHSARVGFTQWAKRGEGDASLPGPEPTFFFAPTQAKQCRDRWGPEEFVRRLGEAWSAFMKPVTDPVSPWMVVQHGEGLGATVAVYQALLRGDVAARTGHVATI